MIKRWAAAHAQHVRRNGGDMSAEEWVVLAQHHIPTAWVPIDAGESELLFIESALLEAGIEVVFDPRRPGINYFTRSAAMDLKLLVKESDLPRAREVLRDIESGPPPTSETTDWDSMEGRPLTVGDRVRFPSARPDDTVWGGYDAVWDTGDDTWLGQAGTVVEVDADGWFRLDIGPADGWFVPAWVVPI